LVSVFLNQKAIAAVEGYFADLTKNRYRDGMMALEHRWNKCINLKGDYVGKSKRIPSIFKDESTRSCICLWKLAVAVATYVSICIVYCILPSFAF
jgi:hypothetical protein